MSGFFGDLFRVIRDVASWIIDGVLDVLKLLFVPGQEFFTNMISEIQTRFDAKFGGLLDTGAYLNSRFSGVRAYSGMDGLFTVTFPRESFLYGISANLIEPAADILFWMRLCMTGIFVLLTAIACYRLVIRLIQN